MKGRSVVIFGIAGLVLFALGAASVWLYQRAADFDAAGQRPSFKGRVMKRKSDAMQDLMDAVLAGNLKGADAQGRRLAGYYASIDGFLETDMYERAGSLYRSALQDLQSATQRNDWVAAKEATLAIEQSCLDCHQQLLSGSATDPHAD